MAKAKKPADIDGYISQFSDDVRAILRDVREAIRLLTLRVRCVVLGLPFRLPGKEAPFSSPPWHPFSAA